MHCVSMPVWGLQPLMPEPKLLTLLLLQPVAVLALHAALLDVMAQGKTAPKRKSNDAPLEICAMCIWGATAGWQPDHRHATPCGRQLWGLPTGQDCCIPKCRRYDAMPTPAPLIITA